MLDGTVAGVALFWRHCFRSVPPPAPHCSRERSTTIEQVSQLFDAEFSKIHGLVPNQWQTFKIAELNLGHPLGSV